jgi:colicin import membrane protein
MAEQNLSVDIKIKADTSGAKEAEKAIDGLTQAIEEQKDAEKELVTETEKVVVEEKKLVEVEKEVEKAIEKTTEAKKKKVVEEKKEVAAVEELAVAEKKVIDTTGMYIDAKGRVHEASGKFVKVAETEREGLKERIKLQEQETGVVGKATVTTNSATQAKKELGKASNNGAMGLLALSNAVQDVQYGFGGMVNNIPQIVTGLGMGMGVAGAVQIAAVGFQFLLKNVDLFGEKAKEAARNAADLASDAMADADAAYKVAEATKAATESQERHNEAMQAAEERYKEQIRLSEELIKQKQAEKDAEIALADAQAGFEMAQIQLAEGRGEISKEEAIIARNKVRTEADARKQTAAIALEEAKVAEARKKAAAEEAQAQANRGMALQLAGEGQGMMTKEDRDLAGKNMGSAQTQLEQSRIRQAELADKITQEERIVKSTAADVVGVFDKEKIQKTLYENRQKLAKEQEEAAKLQADINREDEKIKKDKEARLKTGVKDGDRKNLDEKIQAQFSEAKAAEMRAAGFMGEAATGESGIAQSQKLFGMRQATGAMQAQAQIEAERRAKQEEERRAQEKAAAEEVKAKEKEQREREKEWAEVKPAGRKLATSLKGSGVNESFISELESAADESAESFDGMSKLYRLIQKLTSNTSKLTAQAKADLERLEAEIDDLKLAK